MFVLTSLVVAALALWLLGRDRRTLAAAHELREAGAAADRRLAILQDRSDRLAVDLAAQEQAVMRSEKSMREARQLQSTWDWLGGGGALQKANRLRRVRMEAEHAFATTQLGALKQELGRVRWEQAQAEVERDRLLDQWRTLTEAPAGAPHSAARTWLRVCGWLVLAVAAYLLGPVLGPLVWRRLRAPAR